MLIVDRIENSIAVVEDGDSFFNIPISELPPETREGSVLVRDGDRYVIDAEATSLRSSSIKSRFERLKKKSS